MWGIGDGVTGDCFPLESYVDGMNDHCLFDIPIVGRISLRVPGRHAGPEKKTTELSSLMRLKPPGDG